jgi:ubiquinol-cytochrome c reductase cytochrome c1 subunit
MKTLFALLLLTLSAGALAVDSAVPLANADVDVFDLKSVRRGAAYFVNDCMGCHSIKHLRYSRLGQDLGLKEDEMRRDVMLDGVKIYDSLLTAMNKQDAENWFGVAPPDLSLVARARGADWLLSYLKGFYADPSRPSGTNNVVFPDVGMPNVLWELQGVQKPVMGKRDGAEVIQALQIAEPGRLSGKEFDAAMTDLVNFLVYAAEPAQYQRLMLGKYVVFALLLLAVLFYRLKKEYWKDVH